MQGILYFCHANGVFVLEIGGGKSKKGLPEARKGSHSDAAFCKRSRTVESNLVCLKSFL